MNATLTDFDTHLDEGRPGPEPTRLRRVAAYYGPVLALYGTLKLIGFSVFLLLLHSAGDFRDKHHRFGGGAHPCGQVQRQGGERCGGRDRPHHRSSPCRGTSGLAGGAGRRGR